ncbi:MAG: heme-binding protein [Woeseia sp.]
MTIRWKIGGSLPLTILGLGFGMAVQSPAWAQEDAEHVISPEAAEKTLNRHEISVAAAEKVAKACVAYAAERDWSLSVFILGPSGNIVYAYRMDGENPIEVDTAWRKAQTVLYMRTSTHAMIERYGQDMQATMFNLGQFPYTGGLPIMVGSQMIGAIGVGGATGAGDEQCAYEALTKVIGPQPPLAGK